jgi:hypothetical protein
MDVWGSSSRLVGNPSLTYAPTPRFSIEEIRAFGEPMVAITVEASRETHHERGSNEEWVRRGASNERPKPSGTRSLFGNNTV